MMLPTNRKRLLILSFSPISSDARVLKQVNHFVTDYEVVTCGYGESPAGVGRHYRIADDTPFREHSRELLVLRQYRRMYWHSAAVMYARAVLAAEEQFDVILANDIETVGLALELKPRHGVHADIHEYAPRLNEEIPVWKAFVAPYVRWLCRTYLRRANSVTTVGQGIADEYLRVFGIAAGVVTNAAPAASVHATPVGDPIRIVHSGAALRNRGLDEVIAAVEESTANLTLDLFLMPNDVAYLQELTAKSDATERITVHDPVPYSALISTLNRYDLGIHVIPPINFNNTMALPNKFFDYVQARLGVIIGPSAEMARIVEEHGLGAISAGFSIGDITAVLDTLTGAAVARWKGNAELAAHDLSAEKQVAVWDAAVGALARAPESRSQRA
jgi:hypothetical protein